MHDRQRDAVPIPSFYGVISRIDNCLSLEATIIGGGAMLCQRDVTNNIAAGHTYGEIDRIIRMDLAAGTIANVTAPVALQIMADINIFDETSRRFCIAFIERTQPYIWDNGAWINTRCGLDWTTSFRQGDVVFPDRD